MMAANQSVPDESLAVEITSLVKTYAGVRAVDDLSLSVPQSCFFGFLGPNGAGKTTTIKMLMGLSQPDSGSIRIFGRKLPEDALWIKQQIGLVPDDSLLFDYLKGAEYLEFIGRLYGLTRELSKERARELLGLFQLAENDQKLIGEYSKGMRKRIAMAAALIHRPKLFLMDEPFEGVDAVGARLMKDILLEQVAHGATVFLTSHVLDVVERLCDQVAIINRGHVVRQGTIAELRHSGGSEGTLEDVFVNIVGGDRYGEKLDWL
jgi:ABC-2 type transport system ATP-binding protein